MGGGWGWMGVVDGSEWKGGYSMHSREDDWPGHAELISSLTWIYIQALREIICKTQSISHSYLSHSGITTRQKYALSLHTSDRPQRTSIS